jgi:hypothetical protein
LCANNETDGSPNRSAYCGAVVPAFGATHASTHQTAFNVSLYATKYPSDHHTDLNSNEPQLPANVATEPQTVVPTYSWSQYAAIRLSEQQTQWATNGEPTCTWDYEDIEAHTVTIEHTDTIADDPCTVLE